MKDGRVYDPLLGQYLTPDWENVLEKVKMPQKLSLYRLNGNDPINVDQSIPGLGKASITLSNQPLDLKLTMFLLSLRSPHLVIPFRLQPKLFSTPTIPKIFRNCTKQGQEENRGCHIWIRNKNFGKNI